MHKPSLNRDIQMLLVMQLSIYDLDVHLQTGHNYSVSIAAGGA